MNEKIYRKKVTDGQKFDFTRTTEGFTEVFLPRIKALMDDADRKCHPTSSQFRVDDLKFHVGYYNGIKAVLDEVDIIISERDNAIKTLNRENSHK